MTITYLSPLTNARGLGKVVFFSGLDFPIVITPGLLGEPILTAQPFYFLERLDSVASARFESPKDLPGNTHAEIERSIEYILDNYLFEYSKLYPYSKMTSKITELVYWKDDPDYHYHQYDWRMTQCLIMDTLNDPIIIQCSDPNHEDKEHWYDWCLFRSYFEDLYEDYQRKLKEAMGIVVSVETDDHPSLGIGKFELPILTTTSQPLTLGQAQMLEVIRPNEPNLKGDSYLINRGIPSENDWEIPQETITAKTHYNAELLAYYFCAVRDHSPISQFKNYYNVLEYFFEDAPVELGIVAKFEYQQIEAVFRWSVLPQDLSNRIKSLPPAVIIKLSQDQITSSGELIPGLDLATSDIIKDYSNHLYKLRNACVHSKRTRKGLRTARIVPSTEEEHLLLDELPILQWLAVKCIEREVSS